jgi:hypothetical protein
MISSKQALRALAKKETQEKLGRSLLFFDDTIKTMGDETPKKERCL